MTKNKRPVAKSNDNAQTEKFKAAARELGCDEDEAAFERRLRKIAKADTKGVPPPKPVRKRSGT